MNCVTCKQPVTDIAKFCTHCGAAVPVVAFAGSTTEPPTVEPPQVAVPATKPCSYCGEQILASAIRCRYCCSDLLASRQSQNGISVQGPSAGTPPSIVIQNVQSSQGQPPAFVAREIKNPGIAMLLSLVIPGGGQFYNGHAGKGLLILCTCWLIIPWIYGIFDAYSCAERINRVGF